MLDSLIAPTSVAVIGASPEVAGHAGRAVANLVRTGFTGRIHPVNPKHREVQGLQCYPTVGDIPGSVDAAYILLPAHAVVESLRQCAAKGVRSVVVCTAGFAELGEIGREAQAEMKAIADESGMRILGPNCIGVLNVVDRYVGCPTFNITYDYVPGGVTFLSHSGGTAVTLFNRAQGRGLGVRTVVSLGNEADLDVAELLEAFVDDPQTTVIALYLEQIKNGNRFLEAVSHARRVGKPVVALKSGRSAVGKQTILGHTGAMAGEHAVFADVMRQAGVLEVTSIDEMLLACAVLQLPRPTGPRIGVVSPSGGECTYVADRAETRDLQMASLSADTTAAIGARLRFGNPSNPLDLTGQVIGDGALLADVLREFFADPAIDMGVVSIPTWGPYDSERLLPVFLHAAQESGKPVAISAWSARNVTEVADMLLRASDLPTFSSADDAVDALGLLFRYWALRDEVSEPATLTRTEPLPFIGSAAAEHQAKAALASVGISVSREVLAASVDELVPAAAEIGFPLVLKLMAQGIVHKSEYGFVATNLHDAESTIAAADIMLARASAEGFTVDGLLVAAQEHGCEMIVGGVVDPTFGPVVLVGAGGTLAEQFHDTAFLRAPAGAGAVRNAISGLRVHAVLSGARGTTYDTEALVEVVVRASEVLAASPHVTELDLNPVIVRTIDAGGAVVVDAVINEAVAVV